MKRAIIEYFRCPEEFVDFQLSGRFGETRGYFRFGAETICYGRSSTLHGRQAVGSLHDALAGVTTDGGTVRLPFEPDEVVENFRYERYQAPADLGGSRLGNHPAVKRLYYALRPFLPVSIRKHLQRAHLSDWKSIPFPTWPVDRTAEHLLERLLLLAMKGQGVQRVPFVWFWPDGATSCAIMTHDVEHLAGRDFCSQLMDLDDSVGIKASFQIVPESRYPVTEALLQEIRDRGFEVNVHDLNHDGRLFAEYREFLRRAAKINAYAREYGARGFRSGAIYRNQSWYHALAFSYDMSVPSVGHLDPQRGGCCSLMPFFIGGILELPLTTIQDYSLFHILNDYALDLWKQQIDAIADHHGLVSFIVHPDYVIDKRPRVTYQSLLAYLAKMRAERKTWIALPRDVDRWWRQRHELTVVRNGDQWRIDGAGKERARLAFAVADGDRLGFTIEEPSRSLPDSSRELAVE